MRSLKDQNAFACASPSPLSAQVGVCISLKRVRSAGETRSHEDLNAFASQVKRVRSTCLLDTLHLTGTVHSNCNNQVACKSHQNRLLQFSLTCFHS